MGLEFWDVAMRGAAAALLGLLATLFAREARQSLTARLGMLLTIGGMCYLALPVIPRHLELGLWRVPVHVLSVATPGIFWLFAASWFDDDFRLKRWHVALVGFSVASGIAANYYHAFTGTTLWPAAIGWRVVSITLVAMGIVIALKGRDADLVESRRRVRIAVAVATGIVILGIVFSELPLRQWPPPVGLRLINSGSLLLLAGTMAVAILGWRDPGLVGSAPRAAMPAAAPVGTTAFDDGPLLARLEREMLHDRLYRQDGLTITTVAARLGVPEYRLRRAINQGLGARNFNAYLNDHRLREAEQALADPAQREVPILTIAMDAGFGSLAPFNRAFRDRHGCTPTDYRNRSLNG